MTVRIKAKQSLGQNFLTDANVADNIVSAMQLKSNDIVVEIGPGRGMLTKRICGCAKKCIALEIDQRLIHDLEDKFTDADNIKVIHQDVLKFDFSSVARKNKVKVVGNIPYHITSPIFFKILENRQYVKELIMLVQREVAERFVSVPHSKEYGILAVLAQTYADVDLLMRVAPTVFKPQPKVESALVRWTFKRDYENNLMDADLHRLIVRQAFGQRRKMMRRSLRNLLTENIRIDLTRRPEDLSIQDWIDLANTLTQLHKQESRND